MNKRDARGDAPLIVLKNLQKAYRTPAGDFYALKGIDLEIWPGEFVALLGRSGAGKSTLINMLTGIDRPTAGEIWIQNKAIHRMSEGKLTQWRGREVGVVFQSFQLMPMLTCAQNVMLPMDFAGLYGTSRQQYARARDLLAAVEIAEHADKLPSAVSGGQRQRVAIARALANDPAFLAADEPTGSLDSRTADAVFAVFQRLVDAGKTLFMATHDRELASRVSRTLRIEDGLIVEDRRLTDAQEEQSHVAEMGA
ncbi:MAG: ABC transporter ATP-binding protein [Caldilineaceae bacterium]|jgi:putative ABC transport system ATP-binding protein|nr:ABC transporter ATP-binding protein [Caldilineaceae bacterium]